MLYFALLCIFGYVYEDADSLIVDNDTFTICGEHTYISKVLIRNSGHVFVRPWSGLPDTTGWLVIRTQSFELTNASSVNGSCAGYRGGTNTHADGHGPGYGGSGLSGGGGGAGYGGYGGDGGDTDPGSGGIPYGNASDTLIQMGSGGGAGRLSQIEGFGGNGGAHIEIWAQTLYGQSAALIADGESGDDAGLEAGGGGSGGGIMMSADSVSLHDITINANAGAGGSASFGGGGGGGGGRIKVFYTTHLDTLNLVTSADRGLGGYGGYGNGDPGTNGTVHVGYMVGLTGDYETPGHCFTVFMNPVRNHLIISTKSFPLPLVIRDVTGRHVKHIILTQPVQVFSLEGVPGGVYLLNVAGDMTAGSKIIILH